MRDSRRSLISDHALLRYMQRVIGLDIEAFEKMMWSAVSSAAPDATGKLIGPDGEVYIEGDNGSIITVLCAGDYKRRMLRAAKHQRHSQRLHARRMAMQGGRP